MGRFSKLETQRRKEEPSRVPKSNRVEHGVYYAPAESSSDRADLDVAACMDHGDQALLRDDWKNALRWHSRAMDKDSSAIAPWVAMIRVLLLRGDLREAFTWITRGLTVFPNAPQLMALRAVGYARRGMMRQAINNADAVLEQHGDDAFVHMARGETLLLAESKNADYCFEQCLKLSDAQDWRTPMHIAMILRERRQFARALHYLTLATERNASAAGLWYQAGQCQAALGHTGQAAKAFGQARELCPADDPLMLKIDAASSGSIWSRLMNLFR